MAKGGKRPGAGRPKGAQTEKLWRDAIKVAVNELRDDPDNGGKVKALRLLARQLVDEGIDGDVPALKEIGDRLDGKPTQAISGPDGGSIPISFGIEFVKPDNETS